MLFLVEVLKDGESIYSTSVSNMDAARNTAEYFAAKYDDQAQWIRVISKEETVYCLRFDKELEDWRQATEEELAGLG